MPKYPDRKLDIRRLTGMSQAETAAMLGISRPALANVEAGHRADLPAAARLFHAMLMAAMQKAHHPVPEKPADADLQKLKETLQQMQLENRLQSMKLQRQMNKLQHKKSQQPWASRLIACVEKVHIDLLAQSEGSAWHPITPRQKKWLEMAKSHQSLLPPGKNLDIEQALLELRQKLLQQEAAALEEMIAGLDPALV